MPSHDKVAKAAATLGKNSSSKAAKSKAAKTMAAHRKEE